MKRWNDGTLYTGEFLDGEMHGQGLLLRADGICIHTYIHTYMHT